MTIELVFTKGIRLEGTQTSRVHPYRQTQTCLNFFSLGTLTRSPSVSLSLSLSLLRKCTRLRNLHRRRDKFFFPLSSVATSSTLAVRSGPCRSDFSDGFDPMKPIERVIRNLNIKHEEVVRVRRVVRPTRRPIPQLFHLRHLTLFSSLS